MCEETADQCVGGRGGDTKPPGGQIPEDGTEDAAQQYRNGRKRIEITNLNELANGVGYRRAAKHRPQEFERGDDDDRLDRRHGTRGDHSSNDIGCVVEAVGVIEYQHYDDGSNGKHKDSIHVFVNLIN